MIPVDFDCLYWYHANIFLATFKIYYSNVNQGLNFSSHPLKETIDGSMKAQV